MQIVDLLRILAIFYGDLWAFDTHFGVNVLPFPYFTEAPIGDWAIAKLGDATSNNVRRWQDAVVDVDGLQLVQTQSRDIVGGRGDGEGRNERLRL